VLKKAEPIDMDRFMEGYKSFDARNNRISDLLKTDSRFMAKMNS